MRPDLYLKNGTVVTETGIFHGGETVANGVIAQVVADTPAIDAAETIDGCRPWARNPSVVCTTRM